MSDREGDDHQHDGEGGTVTEVEPFERHFIQVVADHPVPPGTAAGEQVHGGVGLQGEHGADDE